MIKQRRQRSAGRRRGTPLAVELLESRSVPSANSTLDQALPLTWIERSPPAGAAPSQLATVRGTIGWRSDGAGEVDWYTFTLADASAVQLTTTDVAGGRHFDSALALYNTESSDPNYPFDFSSPPFDPQQHRLLAQLDTVADAPATSIDRDLAAGTYFVAVSSAGNDYFNIGLAASGYAGSVGDYQLDVSATSLQLQPTDGPMVLATDPAMTTDPANIPVVHASPLVLDVDLSAPLDPTTVTLAQPGSQPGDPPPTVQLTYNPQGHFGDGNDSQVILAGFHFAADADELQLKVAAPLAPGYYQLTLLGNPGPDQVSVLTDPTDTMNLGQDNDHPQGQDWTAVFRIDGSEGILSNQAVADDTPATARDFGDITQAGRVQAVGAIGDDPAYDPSLPRPDPNSPTPPAPPFLWNPAAQVDLYHFRITGSGSYDFGAEVFAGRIGSTLDPALSLFELDPSDPSGPLHFVASNGGSRNNAVTSDGLLPFFTDPVLFADLTAGDYYVAVSSAQNMPSLSPDSQPGTNGIFDPNVSHSGYNGSSTGDYVLNVLVQPAAPSPRVVATTPADGTTLDTPPTQITVTFDSPVNVTQLADQAFDATSQSTVSGVFVVGADGQRYFPRLESYDVATNQATFLMLDRLPNGVNALHFSGANGLAGYGGSPVLGNDPNDPSRDYVVRFTVADPTNSAGNNPLLRTEQEPNDTLDSAQDLGVLFPRELHSGVTVAGTLQASAQGGTPDVDYYVIQVLQDQEYHFALTGPSQTPGDPTDAPAGAQLTITDATGTAVEPLPQDNPNAIYADLAPGKYVIRIGRSSTGALDAAGYEVHITILNEPENPPPLTVGSAPALQIRLNNPQPTPTPPAPPVVVVQIPSGADGPTVPLTTGVVLVSTQGDKPSAVSTEPLLSGRLPAATTAPIDLLQVLRGDLQGGVTTTTINAVSLPLQIRGLDNTAAPLTGKSSAGVVGFFSFLGDFLPSSNGDPRGGHGPEDWRWWFDLFLRGTDNVEPVPEPGPSNQTCDTNVWPLDWPLPGAVPCADRPGVDHEAGFRYGWEGTGSSLVEWAAPADPQTATGSGRSNWLCSATLLGLGFFGRLTLAARTAPVRKPRLPERKSCGR